MSKHSVRATIVGRDPNVWQVQCGRHATFTGPTYEAAEDEWRRHVHEVTGIAPRPFGAQENRWMP